ncbi:MAG TPA: hypothetical protein DC009_09345 [Porphyromonadaceae bacterium]|nr:hypothetical protein [Porphyromonadaceae bacterium]
MRRLRKYDVRQLKRDAMALASPISLTEGDFRNAMQEGVHSLAMKLTVEPGKLVASVNRAVRQFRQTHPGARVKTFIFHLSAPEDFPMRAMNGLYQAIRTMNWVAVKYGIAKLPDSGKATARLFFFYK